MNQHKTASQRLLAPGSLWLMALPYRLLFRRQYCHFSPGLKNLVKYEALRLWLGLYDREKLAYFKQRLRRWLG